MKWFLFLGFLVISFTKYNSSYHWVQLSLFIYLFFLFISFRVSKKIHLSFGLLFLWIASRALYILLYTWNFPTGLRYIDIALGIYSKTIKNPSDATLLIVSIVSLSLLSIVALVYFVDSIKSNIDKSNIYRFLTFMVFLNSIYIIICYLWGWNVRRQGGMFGVSAPNGIFIAIIYPMFFATNLLPKQLKNYKKIICPLLFILPIITLFMLQATIPIIILSIALSSYFFNRVEGITTKFIIISNIFLILFIIGFTLDKDFLNDSNRFNFFKIVFKDFFSSKNIFLGTGTGTFKIYSMGIQLANKFMFKEWFMWAHSDALQIMYENGIIGLVLTINAMFWTLIKAFNRPVLFASNCAMIAAIFGSYPLHYGHTAVLCSLLVILTFYKEEEKLKSLKNMNLFI